MSTIGKLPVRWLHETIVLCWLTAVLSSHSALAVPLFSGVLFEDGPALSPVDLLPAYRQQLGSPLDEGLQTRLPDAFIRHYRSAGLLPPAPRVVAIREDAGIVVMAVQEARVSQVRVNGSEPERDSEFWLLVRELKEIRPLSRAAFDAWLDRVNRAGFAVQGSLTRAAPHSHHYLATLTVAERRWHVLLHLDNRAPEELGREVAQASVGYRFTDARLGYLRLDTAAAIDTDRLRYFGAYGEHRLRRRGESIRWRYSSSESSLPVENRDIDVDYERSQLDADIVIPLARRLRLFSDLGVGLHTYDLDQAIDSGVTLRRDRIRALQLAWNLAVARGNRHLHKLTVEARQGLDAFGALLWPEGSGVAAELDFLLADLSYRYQLRLATEWRLLFDLQAQVSADRLPSSERFFVGGNRFGGAFDPATLSGDLGLGGRITAERALPVPWLHSPLLGFAYYDHAYVWSNDGVRTADDAGSAGIGIRGAMGGLSFSLEGAVPVQQPETPTLLEDEPRLYFSISQRF
ncbi:MAG: ShlB/FhaC/HecB family hemolysin secretion/activation protein [Pseudomonadales bacterium]